MLRLFSSGQLSLLFLEDGMNRSAKEWIKINGKSGKTELRQQAQKIQNGNRPRSVYDTMRQKKNPNGNGTHPQLLYPI